MKAMLLLPGFVPGRERSLKFMLQRKDGTIFFYAFFLANGRRKPESMKKFMRGVENCGKGR